MAVQGWVRGVLACGLLTATTLGTGCGSFFQCEGKADCGTSSSSTSSNNVVYAANENSPGLYSYQIGSGGTLTGLSGSPLTLSSVATAMAVTPDNSLLYVAEASGTIFSYAISTTGALSNVTQQSTATVQTAAMTVSPDGQWLLTLDYSSAGSTISPYLRVYKIGAAGSLSSAGTGFALSSTQSILTYQVAMSADGKNVALALGPAGIKVYPFTTSNASFGNGIQIDGSNGNLGDNGVAWDASDNLYVAQSGATNGVTVYPAGFSSGTTGTTYTVGNGPRSPVFASSGAYFYTANLADSTISAATVSKGVLTAVGSATGGPSGVQQLAVDQSGKYVIAAGTSGAAGLETFTIASSGGVTAAGTAATGASNGIPVIAVTH